jgi:hypothetical protein
MATADETNTKQLPEFSSLKAFEQMAIVLHSEGRPYEEIVNMMNAEYDLAYKLMTVREWFWAGGRLEQAYLEYNEANANQHLAHARQKIKQLSLKAANTLDELMDTSTAGTVRQQAAKTVLSKYIPDRQIIVDESKTEDLPDKLAADMDAELEDKDGPDKVDEPQQSEDSTQEVRPGSDQAVSPAVLQESETTDRSGNPPA